MNHLDYFRRLKKINLDMLIDFEKRVNDLLDGKFDERICINDDESFKDKYIISEQLYSVGAIIEFHHFDEINKDECLDKLVNDFMNIINDNPDWKIKFIQYPNSDYAPYLSVIDEDPFTNVSLRGLYRMIFGENKRILDFIINFILVKPTGENENG